MPVQQQVSERWGAAERDPFFRPGRLDCGRFAIPGFRVGNIAVLIQPARGYNLDPKSTYHDPALVPPHSYLAAYAWLADSFRADAVIDLGKHGTLEWLPGKALALSAECFPEAVLGPLPHLYPFIVNDPGEGSQAKRRAQAVIVDHLTPPLTRAGSYGPQAELERLIDEYYEAARGDVAAHRAARRRHPGTRRAPPGSTAIAASRAGEDTGAALQKLDGFLCELKELQIRDGLHVLGASPDGERLDALLVAIARARRGGGAEDESLLRALAADLDLGADPLMLDLAEPWTGPRPGLANAAPARVRVRAVRAWRTAGDTVERLEALALRLSPASGEPAPEWHRTRAVLGWIERSLRPAVRGLRTGRDRRGAGRSRRQARRARAERRAEPRPARGVADRAQFLLGRYPRGADPGRLAARLAFGRRCSSSATPRSTATTRRGSRCRPGAPRTCAPAATTSRRRWR